MQKIKQFNWNRQWPKVEPHVNDPEVQHALDVGMTFLARYWKSGDSPADYGRGAMNGQRVVRGKLSWYQPWGRCHWIAPFAWAIGKKLYPDFKWGFLTSEHHTVAVGLKDKEIMIVMDIVNFKRQSAKQSIEQVKRVDWKLCFSIKEVF